MQLVQEGLQVIEMAMRGRALPVGPDKSRTTVTLPKELLERVKAYRFDHKHESVSDALAALIERALDAADLEREQQEQDRRRS